MPTVKAKAKSKSSARISNIIKIAIGKHRKERRKRRQSRSKPSLQEMKDLAIIQALTSKPSQPASSSGTDQNLSALQATVANIIQSQNNLRPTPPPAPIAPLVRVRPPVVPPIAMPPPFAVPPPPSPPVDEPMIPITPPFKAVPTIVEPPTEDVLSIIPTTNVRETDYGDIIAEQPRTAEQQRLAREYQKRMVSQEKAERGREKLGKLAREYTEKSPLAKRDGSSPSARSEDITFKKQLGETLKTKQAIQGMGLVPYYRSETTTREKGVQTQNELQPTEPYRSYKEALTQTTPPTSPIRPLYEEAITQTTPQVSPVRPVYEEALTQTTPPVSPRVSPPASPSTATQIEFENMKAWLLDNYQNWPTKPNTKTKRYTRREVENFSLSNWATVLRLYDDTQDNIREGLGLTPMARTPPRLEEKKSRR